VEELLGSDSVEGSLVLLFEEQDRVSDRARARVAGVGVERDVLMVVSPFVEVLGWLGCQGTRRTEIKLDWCKIILQFVEFGNFRIIRC